MGDQLNAYLPNIQRFIDGMGSLGSPEEVHRELPDGCSLLAECASLAKADQESSQFLQTFLTEAEQGFRNYVLMARQSMIAYQQAGEAAAWEVTNRTKPGEGLKPFEGAATTPLGPSPLALPQVQPPGNLWPEIPAR
ncbi:hypothetical protein [Amycolatopsis thailandensis]|uniref:PE domain-containing protein n=1 Tax=Amycolatopsis thailandensis TaxID=589330 RepID=A0A229SEZ4_9PSEU|nr:hypothetical protein [Amycolatopsis thailandensis]OXM57321.1 hypothetical protein CFP71_08595 [Amycolatopsis thailandensis]